MTHTDTGVHSTWPTGWEIKPPTRSETTSFWAKRNVREKMKTDNVFTRWMQPLLTEVSYVVTFLNHRTAPWIVRR
jgi:hypothetical protein